MNCMTKIKVLVKKIHISKSCFMRHSRTIWMVPTDNVEAKEILWPETTFTVHEVFF